jgi:hypothetical protein
MKLNTRRMIFKAFSLNRKGVPLPVDMCMALSADGINPDALMSYFDNGSLSPKEDDYLSEENLLEAVAYYCPSSDEDDQGVIVPLHLQADIFGRTLDL